ncbi:MAG: NUDIX hydrolase [Euryarchaeota archaeon]|jgi:8-oxo-dGTP diphosphatase|nr:NUDIX hydrolase [Euryarchaeota archaeon]MBT3847382.1 NUDIX hydrolase [Euryarchaeota archaeon]MBT4157021.1 NUDIX hydrolase [Euryarchaeota archaeon]MBT4181181.1 NUDIX hydrolase [Euryarchaeota archaeon]MBT4475058.1 NUDIX hydrolase [Euryarchaeota archaeon]
MAVERCSKCGRDDYQSPSVTVDAIATRNRNEDLELLMIKRGSKPPEWNGMWAFPGGFVDYGEDPEDAVIRELLEETGVQGRFPLPLTILGKPERDPRKHCIGLFYLVEVDSDSEPVGGDDAVDAKWVNINKLTEQNVAGDHSKVIDILRE